MTNPVIIELRLPEDKHAPQAYKGKFLQISWRAQEYLLFATFDQHHYHNQILARFCQNNAIRCRWVGEETLEVNDPTLAVLGGGRFDLDAAHKALNLSDNSQAYGRFQEKGLLEKIAAADHPCSKYVVKIT